MLGIEILAQNRKQILNVIVKTQPRVIDLKGPANNGFNQSSFVARGVRLKKLVSTRGEISCTLLHIKCYVFISML